MILSCNDNGWINVCVGETCLNRFSLIVITGTNMSLMRFIGLREYQNFDDILLDILFMWTYVIYIHICLIFVKLILLNCIMQN